MFDKRKLHIMSAAMLVALIISFFFVNGGRILASVLLAISCSLFCIFIRKRGIPSYNWREVAMLLSVIAAVAVMLYYLTGLKFGFYRNGYGIRLEVVLKYILPIFAIIVATEIIRSIIRAQESVFADVISYLAFAFAEVLINYSLLQIFNFNNFMDVMGLVFFPALISNLLYHYLSKRYGALPNIAYRLITTLYVYIIPIGSRIPDSLLAFVRLCLPLAIYFFIDFLYEKKKKYALARTNKLSAAISAVVLIAMAAVVMLISNSFQYGAYVIATESMTGELNKGDIAIYEEYNGQSIDEGQVVVFHQNGGKVIHRVVKKENINGQNRYYTKGDANEDQDVGYITDGDIKGVVELKLPYFGYPTLWLREFISELL